MTDIITEALLEMHFHPALVAQHIGKRHGYSYQLLKPSPQNERWVGFDQGWVATSLDTKTLFQHLRQAIASQSTSVQYLLYGYFLQFKVVREMKRQKDLTVVRLAAPHYRVTLDLKPNKTTLLSQHETLIRLANIGNASVHYACPMFFGLHEIYLPPALSNLVTVDLRNAPAGWLTGEKHYIYFQNKTGATPHWASVPTPARVRSGVEWAATDLVSRPIGVDSLEEQIEEWTDVIGKQRSQSWLDWAREEPTRVLPESFRLLVVRLSSASDTLGPILPHALWHS